MSSYYCLIAGLPDITIEDNKLNFTIKEFYQELSEVLSNEDKRYIDLFYLQFDNKNLLALLMNKESKWDDRGIYSEDDLQQVIQLVKENESPNNKRFPSYFFRFTAAYLEEKAIYENLSWEDQLASLYYEYASKCNNTFVSDWFDMNLNLNNILTSIACRKYNKDLANAIVGSSEISNTIRKNGQRDLRSSGMIEYIDTIIQISEIGNLFERERKLDQFRWKWLEEQSFFLYFTIEQVFAYLVKLDILERWVRLNPETGRSIFKNMIESLKKWELQSLN